MVANYPYLPNSRQTGAKLLVLLFFEPDRRYFFRRIIILSLLYLHLQTGNGRYKDISFVLLHNCPQQTEEATL